MEIWFYVVEWIILVLLLAPSSLPACQNRIRRWAGGFIYVFFAAFRNVMTPGLDVYAFYNRFEKTAVIPLKTLLTNGESEPGYIFLAWLIKHITGSYVVFLAIIHLFVYCSLVYFIDNIPWKNHRYLLTGVLCINLFSVYYLQRNIMAVAFSMIMFVKLCQKKNKLAFFALILAILSHYSAVILIPAFCFIQIFNQKRNANRWKITTFSITAVCILVLISPFIVLFGKYTVYQGRGGIAWATDFVAIFTMIFYLRNIHKLKANIPVANILGLSVFTILLIIPIQMQYNIMYRMLLYFQPIMAIMLMYITDVYKKTPWFYMFSLFSTMYYLYYIISFFAKETIYIGIPYRLAF